MKSKFLFKLQIMRVLKVNFNSLIFLFIIFLILKLNYIVFEFIFIFFEFINNVFRVVLVN